MAVKKETTKKEVVKKETTKKETTKKSANPVGRPRKKHGAETFMNNKKSFKINNNDVVFDKYLDPLLLAAIALIIACLVLYFAVK